jgi:hypothetical protein
VVAAKRPIDLVTNCEFGIHSVSSRTQALRLIRLKCGFFAIEKWDSRLIACLARRGPTSSPIESNVGS